MAKSDDEIVCVGEPIPKIEAVAPLADYCVGVKWRDGDDAIVDLGPTISTYKFFAPLRQNRALFESVHVVNASVIAWGYDDAIDMHVLEIARLAKGTMDGAAFQAFLERMGLTWERAAALLGVSRRTIGYYAKSKLVPRYIALACAHLENERCAGPKPAYGLADV